MAAIEKLQLALKMTDARMQEWISIFTSAEARILPSQDRPRRLREIRNDADMYFTAEMDSRFRDAQPLTYAEIQGLVDDLFREVGINDMPPRQQPTKRPPWQTTN